MKYKDGRSEVYHHYRQLPKLRLTGISDFLSVGANSAHVVPCPSFIRLQASI